MAKNMTRVHAEIIEKCKSELAMNLQADVRLAGIVGGVQWLTPSAKDGQKIVDHAIWYIRFDRWDGTNTTLRATELDADEIAAVDILASALLDIRREVSRG